MLTEVVRDQPFNHVAELVDPHTPEVAFREDAVGEWEHTLVILGRHVVSTGDVTGDVG